MAGSVRDVRAAMSLIIDGGGGEGYGQAAASTGAVTCGFGGEMRRTGRKQPGQLDGQPSGRDSAEGNSPGRGRAWRKDTRTVVHYSRNSAAAAGR